MRLPDGGLFVDGSPDGGTIVRAKVINGILGELAGILALWGAYPQGTGDLPSDHRQVSQLLARHWLRVGGAQPPLVAEEGAVWLDPVALRNGDPYFYVFHSGAWLLAPLPTLPSSPIVLPAPGSEDAPPFDDSQHGSRGGGDLHAVATESEAGFFTPGGHQTLNQLQAVRPRYFRSGWMPVEPGTVLLVQHDLGRIPDSVQVLYRETGGVVRRVDYFLDGSRAQVGASVYEVTDNVLYIRVADLAWGGETATGYQSFVSGEYQVTAITHGDSV